jgi:hypothetical protein
MGDGLDDFLAPSDPEIRKIVRKARGFLLECIPGAVETKDNENLGFGIAPGYKGLVFTLIPQRNYVNLGVFDGASLPDPEGLWQETGKRHRHVKIFAESDLENPALKKLIEAAIELKVTKTD